MVEFIKCWNLKQEHGKPIVDTTKLFSKPYFLDTRMPVEGMEGCKLKDGKNEVECTKIYYPARFVTVKGTPQEFMEKCSQANVAVCLLQDLYKEGITIKEFMQQNERINAVVLT